MEETILLEMTYPKNVEYEIDYKIKTAITKGGKGFYIYKFIDIDAKILQVYLETPKKTHFYNIIKTCGKRTLSLNQIVLNVQKL